MTMIRANYGAMAAGQDGLVATWSRIEGQLRQLDSVVAVTADMDARALTAFVALKVKWDSAATERQVALRGLADAVGDARTYYQQVDQALAAQFEG